MKVALLALTLVLAVEALQLQALSQQVPGLDQNAFTTPTSGLTPDAVPPVVSPQNRPNTPQMLPGLPEGLKNQYPQFSPDFWKGAMGSRVNPGSILTGTMGTDLSSEKNKVGDIFVIELPDGFTTAAGKLIIPQNSKILGSVTRVVSAKYAKVGMPGTIDVSLQTLVLADGRTVPIYAFISRNPNEDRKQEKRKEDLVKNFTSKSEHTVMGMAGALGGRAFLPVNQMSYSRMNKGPDFKLKVGDVVAVKLTRPLDLSKAVLPTGQPQPQSQPAANQPGTNNGAVPGLVPLQQPF